MKRVGFEFTIPVGVMDERSQMKRDGGEKTAVIQRLARIEGQVRGLKQMVETNRTTVERIQQVHAVLAALREVALLTIAQEVQSQVTAMAGEPADPAEMERLVELLRSSFRLT